MGTDSYSKLFDQTVGGAFYSKYNSGVDPTPGVIVETHDVFPGDGVTAESVNNPHVSYRALLDAILALDDWCWKRAVWRLKDDNEICSRFSFRSAKSAGSEKAYIDSLTGAAGFGTVVPMVDSTYNLGSNAVRWANVYADNIVSSSVAFNAIASHLIPSVDSTYNLGSNAVRWAAIYGDTINCSAVASNFIPTVDSTYDLGSNAVRWANIYGDNIVCTQAAFADIASHLVPSSDSTYNLGSNAVRWAAIYGDRIVTADVGSSLIPSAGSTYDIGSNSVRWTNVYADNMFAGNIAYIVENGSFTATFPTTVTMNFYYVRFSNGLVFVRWDDAGTFDNTNIHNSSDYNVPSSIRSNNSGYFAALGRYGSDELRTLFINFMYSGQVRMFTSDISPDSLTSTLIYHGAGWYKI